MTGPETADEYVQRYRKLLLDFLPVPCGSPVEPYNGDCDTGNGGEGRKQHEPTEADANAPMHRNQQQQPEEDY
jgi:hypothetical protein